MEDKKSPVKQKVIKAYSGVATGTFSFLDQASCSTPGAGTESLLEAGRRLGYSDEELKVGLGEANLGLGCGNPHAIADLQEGETVLDLGSGPGFDAFLSCMKLGAKGHVIGVDMTPDMIIKAKENAEKLGFKNVEFRLGEIEH